MKPSEKISQIIFKKIGMKFVSNEEYFHSKLDSITEFLDEEYMKWKEEEKWDKVEFEIKDVNNIFQETDFMECHSCSIKAGSPILCNSCLHNRNAIIKSGEIGYERGYILGSKINIPVKDALKKARQKGLEEGLATANKGKAYSSIIATIERKMKQEAVIFLEDQKTLDKVIGMIDKVIQSLSI